MASALAAVASRWESFPSVFLLSINAVQINKYLKSKEGMHLAREQELTLPRRQVLRLAGMPRTRPGGGREGRKLQIKSGLWAVFGNEGFFGSTGTCLHFFTM